MKILTIHQKLRPYAETVEFIACLKDEVGTRHLYQFDTLAYEARFDKNASSAQVYSWPLTI